MRTAMSDARQRTKGNASGRGRAWIVGGALLALALGLGSWVYFGQLGGGEGAPSAGGGEEPNAVNGEPETPGGEPEDPQSSEDGGQAGTNGSGGLGDAPDADHDRPERKEALIYLEGMPESFTFERFISPRGFPLPFSTYVVEDLIAESDRTEDGHEIRFVANFAGRRNDEAMLSIRVFPEGTTEQKARESLEELARNLGLRERSEGMPDRHLWTLAEFDFGGSGNGGAWVVGTAMLGRHGDRYFQVVQRYPVEYEEGFGPRVARLFEEWRWEDTGEWLTAQNPAGKDVSERLVAQSESFRVFAPAPGQGVYRPLRVEGAARVFEGTFHIELEDGHQVLAQQVIQVEGAPAWGRFAVDLEYETPTNPAGTLILLYYSPKDGSRVEELLIPLAFLDADVGGAPQ